MLPVLTESKFNGVWFKKSGDRSLPDEMRVSVRKGKFKQTFWVPSAGPEEYETVTLMLDGREHKWSSNCVLCRLGIEGDSTYAAQLNGDTLSVTWRSHISVPPERTIVERFTLRNGGRELVVSNPSGETIYERASWFRALFENGP
jgi:hypothetical protein